MGPDTHEGKVPIEEGVIMSRVTIGGRVVYAAAYDVLTMVLEIQFTLTGEVILFLDVKEDVWYRLKRARNADKVFQEEICGKYVERKLPKTGCC